jgi:uncharacterized membrane protein
MAAGRGPGAQAGYEASDRRRLLEALEAWSIRYVLVGPVERRSYRLDDAAEQRMRDALDVAFERGDVRVYRRRILG